MNRFGDISNQEISPRKKQKRKKRKNRNKKVKKQVFEIEFENNFKQGEYLHFLGRVWVNSNLGEDHGYISKEVKESSLQDIKISFHEEVNAPKKSLTKGKNWNR